MDELFKAVGWLIAILVICAIIGRAFFFQVAQTMSYGMVPNLVPGDTFLVYTRGLLGPGDPVMCKDPDNPGAMIVSRIIGVPNDRVTVSNAKVMLNGREVERNSLGPNVVYEETASGERVPFEVSLSEERMGARAYAVAFMERGRDRREFRHDVKSGFFLVSDNRNRTRDSRHFGEIPIENCIGMPFLVVWPGEDCGDFKKKNRILEWID